MDTVITSLLSSDLFLIETPSYTGTISASQVNYVSTQFSKIYSLIGSYSLNVLETSTDILSVQKIKPFNTNVATVTGNFNTFVYNSGLIVSAYNTTSSEVSSISSTITREISALSASVYNVFFESGTARLTQYIHQYNVNQSTQVTLTGAKIAPTGLVIRAQDIRFKVLFDGFTDIGGNTFVTYNTSFPFTYLKDFDYSMTNGFDKKNDDGGNDYVDPATRRVVLPIIIANMPANDVLFTWKVQKFY